MVMGSDTIVSTSGASDKYSTDHSEDTDFGAEDQCMLV